jgi:hypothetical protein
MNIANITPNGKPYQFTCTMNFIPQTACMLVRSSDFWAKRLHLQQHKVTMFVVWTHDSCLPFTVLCLKDGKIYDPYLCAVDTSKRTKKTSKAFLGQLLSGVQSAFDVLEKMPHPSKRRYEILLDEYGHREHARPLKVGESVKAAKGS